MEVASLSLLQEIFLTQELGSPALQAFSLPAELPGKPAQIPRSLQSRPRAMSGERDHPHAITPHEPAAQVLLRVHRWGGHLAVQTWGSALRAQGMEALAKEGEELPGQAQPQTAPREAPRHPGWRQRSCAHRWEEDPSCQRPLCRKLGAAAFPWTLLSRPHLLYLAARNQRQQSSLVSPTKPPDCLSAGLWYGVQGAHTPARARAQSRRWYACMWTRAVIGPLGPNQTVKRVKAAALPGSIPLVTREHVKGSGLWERTVSMPRGECQPRRWRSGPELVEKSGPGREVQGRGLCSPKPPPSFNSKIEGSCDSPGHSLQKWSLPRSNQSEGERQSEGGSFFPSCHPLLVNLAFGSEQQILQEGVKVWQVLPGSWDHTEQGRRTLSALRAESHRPEWTRHGEDREVAEKSEALLPQKTSVCLEP